ncbi:uncharacterized protein LOC135393222 [Ornithodoros turicata]|uniref:uncharacterized protein LOC135393222 n=1 Tax=Ornithodoros turicata TaxID=34597 RepID=UPI003139669C
MAYKSHSGTPVADLKPGLLDAVQELGGSVVGQDCAEASCRGGAAHLPELSVYLTTPKPQSRVRKTRVPTTQSGPSNTATKRKQALCASPVEGGHPVCGPTHKILRLHSKENADPFLDVEEEDGEAARRRDKLCQTEEGAGCSKRGLQRVKAKLWQAQRALRGLLRRLAHKVVECRTSHVARGKQSEQEKLPQRQRIIFDQWLKKAAAKSAKGMRYSMEWIYDSLLLKIKSTAAYTFLVENEYLPLPDPRTLQSYISSLDANFGFNPDPFTLLKNKQKEVPERERRGKYLSVWSHNNQQVY